MSFPPGTEMFQFPGFAFNPMYSETASIHDVNSTAGVSRQSKLMSLIASHILPKRMVEPDGIEPTTSSLQS
jgi:hypothetical protein